MILLATSAFAADLCAALSQTVRAAPTAFHAAAPLPGAECSSDGAHYSCVFPISFEDDRFPAAWDDVQQRVGACHLGAYHADASADPELLYLPATWSGKEAQVEVRVAGAGEGIEVRVIRAPKS